jgi:hypothetical protein
VLQAAADIHRLISAARGEIESHLRCSGRRRRPFAPHLSRALDILGVAEERIVDLRTARKAR